MVSVLSCYDDEKDDDDDDRDEEGDENEDVNYEDDKDIYKNVIMWYQGVIIVTIYTSSKSSLAFITLIFAAPMEDDLNLSTTSWL